jgi:hypothetical protein
LSTACETVLRLKNSIRPVKARRKVVIEVDGDIVRACSRAYEVDDELRPTAVGFKMNWEGSCWVGKMKREKLNLLVNELRRMGADVEVVEKK